MPSTFILLVAVGVAQPDLLKHLPTCSVSSLWDITHITLSDYLKLSCTERIFSMAASTLGPIPDCFCSNATPKANSLSAYTHHVIKQSNSVNQTA